MYTRPINNNIFMHLNVFHLEIVLGLFHVKSDGQLTKKF